MRAVIIIPARYKSSRFPGKPLTKILDKPMLLWVAELCSKALSKDLVYIATDDLRIKEVVETAGFNVVMTSEKALTGTDRVADAANQIDADIFINVQGDEPLLNPNDIVKIIDEKKKYPDEVINGCCKIEENEDPENLNIPKVVFSEKNKMIYMSRHPIPGTKSKEIKPKCYYKQVCIYAFSKSELMDFVNFGRKGTIEFYEDIEILRFLDIGKEIRIVETENSSLAVDIPSDVEKVEQALLEKGQND
jgi:3-deoxy-manno-octulosonate cytidylyltransferase (CMP-KDO synthetase)